MPIYEYSCGDCGKLIDVLQKVDDPVPEKCEGCGAVGKMGRVVSRTSFVLKGGGWYSDLYGSTKKDGSSGSSAGAASSSSPSKESSASASTPAPASGASTPSTPAPAATAPAAKTEKK
jgi:putative FmdB family regulatory protein